MQQFCVSLSGGNTVSKLKGCLHHKIIFFHKVALDTELMGFFV